ncbi:hypothetical protein [Mechercharimyces sp. CAU 1602]|uniref:hypothetical protein n=1 Tax=Mechercharimyces sp. CAU 1602 TaxID=2973933 RepID=UPI002162C7A2|nr:hypothetical protein [Mechercharimyces sp. CAU 1602]MCS1350231.1 hypothetical protein [Mechercharimyces sp. CAU 1602]
MDILITPLAAARLQLLLRAEEESVPLAIRIVPLTSGCSSPSYAIEITEKQKAYKELCVQGVPLVWNPADEKQIKGIQIDLDRQTGNLTLFHPSPPRIECCPLDDREGAV